MRDPVVQAIFDALPENKRDAVTLILNVSQLDGMPAQYTRAQRERDIVTAVYKAQHGGHLRMLLVAILALLRGSAVSKTQQDGLTAS